MAVTYYRNHMQHALADGTDITAGAGGNLALPTPPTVVSVGLGTIKADVTGGVKSVEIIGGSGAVTYLQWTNLAGATNLWGDRIRLTVPATLPTAFRSWVDIRSANGASSIAVLAFDGLGHLEIVDVAKAVPNTALSSGTFASTSVAAGDVIDVETRFENPTASTGFCSIIVRNAAGTTIAGLGVSYGGTVAPGTENYGTSPIGSFRVGDLTSAGTLGAFKILSLIMQTDSSAAVPDPAATSAPTITAPAYQVVQTGSLVTMTWAPADTDGTVTTIIVTQTGGASQTLSGSGTGARTFTPSVPDVFTFSAIAVDDMGLTSAPAVATVAAYASSGQVRPRALRSNTGAFVAVGTADFVDAVEDEAGGGTPTKYIESVSDPTDTPILYDMQPHRPGAVRISIRARLQPVAGAASTAKVEALTGTSDTEFFEATATLTDGWAIGGPWDLDSTQLAAFTDRGRWAIRVTADKT